MDPRAILGKYFIAKELGGCAECMVNWVLCNVCIAFIFSNPRGRNTLLCTPTTPSRVFIIAQNPANPALLGWDYLNREKVLFYVNALYISLIVNIYILTLFLDIISSFVLFSLLSITLYLFIWVLKYFSLLQPKRLTVKIFIKILIQKWIIFSPQVWKK